MADNDERYGAQGAFLIEAGISSSYHIANFFGLTEWISQPKEASKETLKQVSKETAKEPSKEALKEAARPIPRPSLAPDFTAVLRPLTASSRKPEPPRQPGRGRAIDVSAVITRALTAAGLMK